MDRLTPEARSANMRAVRRKDTAPEMTVRRLLHAAGYRYRLHVKTLPGSPDLVFPGRKKVVFVHGCFWHGHDCRAGRLPKSRPEFWVPKIERNRERDAANIRRLEEAGWATLTVWQCETKDSDALLLELKAFLGSPKIVD